jgi:hypothetical protein
MLYGRTHSKTNKFKFNFLQQISQKQPHSQLPELIDLCITKRRVPQLPFFRQNSMHGIHEEHRHFGKGFRQENR